MAETIWDSIPEWALWFIFIILGVTAVIFLLKKIGVIA